MYKILIVEDDLTIASSLQGYLAKWNYAVEYVTEFKDVMSKFIAFAPDLVLLDIALPFFNGYHWCTEIRKLSNLPIVFISSTSDNMNIVMAMNMGGDDFIAKPFDLGVLSAKLSAILRRTYSFGGTMNAVEYNGAILNLEDATLQYNEKTLELTKNDFKILKTLMESIGKVVSRDEIMKKLWESDSFIDDNTLTVNVTRLRKKLEDIGLYEFIATKKGIGYMVK